ncbi:MAG TPA: hypothetical protein VNZ26_35640, partial [Vicinamibacterales bacterium]|nr:hypothetical protein [Vicinamibacterales bacterium]
MPNGRIRLYPGGFAPADPATASLAGAPRSPLRSAGAGRRPAGVLYLLPALILLVAAALLIIRWVAARPLWLDEEMIAINIRDRSLRDLAGPLLLGQSAPLGWLAAERCLVLMFGTGERVLRLLPVLFGLGTLATAFWIGKRWLDPVGATVLAILCAFSEW